MTQDSTFDPNAASSSESGIFGLPFTEAEASLVFIPVPWEVTTSYGGGTSQGPEAILQASRQVDLFDSEVLRPYEAGLAILPASKEIQLWNQEGKQLAQSVIHSQLSETEGSKALDRVNELSRKLNEAVYAQTRSLLDQKKIVGIVGGDHSVPFGALQAIAKDYANYGILHFDAHSDTRRAFEGFEHSHASIMYNVLEQIPQVTKLVQVGIRDYCEEEFTYTQRQKERVTTFLDQTLAFRKIEGTPWSQIVQEMIVSLPQNVWISFDIDGLDPQLCPHTGTPVPGGLSFQEANYVFRALMKSGRKIIGFDLNEVSPHPDSEWDANVGARLLYKLSAWTLASQNKVKLR